VLQYFFYYYYIGLYYSYYYYSRVENKYIKLNTDIERYSGMDYRYYIMVIATKIHNNLPSSDLNVYYYKTVYTLHSTKFKYRFIFIVY